MHQQRYQSNKCPYEGCGRTRFDTPDALPVHCWHVHGLSVYDTSVPVCLEPGCEELRFESLTRLWEHLDTVHQFTIEPEFQFGPIPSSQAREGIPSGGGRGPKNEDDKEAQETPRFYRGAFYQPLPRGLTPINTRPRAKKRHRPDDDDDAQSPPPSAERSYGQSLMGKGKEELYD